jgi:hypothetical protein
MSRLQRLRDAGVSIWLDTLSRELIDSGTFAHLIAESAVTGATSNPTIFATAITGSASYDDQLETAPALEPRELFFALELERDGVRAFCDAYQRLLDRIEAKAHARRPTHRSRTGFTLRIPRTAPSAGEPCEVRTRRDARGGWRSRCARRGSRPA